MKLSLEVNRGSYIIQSYGVGRITVARCSETAAPDSAPAQQEIVTGSFILTPQALIRDWPPRTVTELTHAHFDTLALYQPQIVIFGSGTRLHFPHPKLTAALHEQGIGLEVMDTGAACRTYNVLLAEGRNVIAAMLML